MGRDNLADILDFQNIGIQLFSARPAVNQSPADGAIIDSAGVVEPAMAEKIGGWKTSRGSHGWGDFDTMISNWKQGLHDGPWLLGEQFSAADIMVGSSAVFLRMFGLLPDSPAINDYADRCLARPAYQKAMSLETSDAD